MNIDINVWKAIIVIAFMGEALWETSKMFWQDGKVSKDRIGALIIAELIAFGAWLDVFAAVGVPLLFNGLIPPLIASIVSVFLTGILISRGANFLHDILTGVYKLAANIPPKEINPGGQITNNRKL